MTIHDHPQLPDAEKTRQSGPAAGAQGIIRRASGHQRRKVASLPSPSMPTCIYGAFSADDPPLLAAPCSTCEDHMLPRQTHFE